MYSAESMNAMVEERDSWRRASERLEAENKRLHDALDLGADGEAGAGGLTGTMKRPEGISMSSGRVCSRIS